MLCFVCLFVFGYIGSLLLRAGFLYLWRVGLLFVVVHGLFIVVASRCGAQAIGTRASVVATRGLSSCGMRALECAGFSSCGARALGHTSSVVVAHRLSCSAACGIFPDRGSNPCPLHWQADSQPLRHQGSAWYHKVLMTVTL